MRIRWRGFELPNRCYCERETLTERYGKFVIEPFERGFGTTIGNSLRRVLISSLEGTAVTSVRFDGAQHEFTAIPGVVEDVTTIVLNLKSLHVRLHTDEPVALTLRKKGKGEVRAADIAPSEKVEIINPDLHLATLADDVEFSAEIMVRKGRGYVTAEEIAEKDAPIGTIPIDAVFSPVERIRYHIEDTRVGQKTNYDRLTVEMWTDGTITPEHAFVEAALILRKHLNPLIKYFELGAELEREAERAGIEDETSRRQRELREKLAMPISILDPSVRAENCLMAANIRTIGDLVSRAEVDLLKIRNFGKATMREIQKKLTDMELSLGMQIAMPEETPAITTE